MARNLDNLLTKENWQNYQMQPGPSHGLGQVFTGKVAGKTSKQTWTCSVCQKELSSKRSYTEHMNIHNKTRPFRCEHCSYAAASQMTLHRHKLRNHTPKAEWGYRCPYCDEAYMEPAGYQQHVQQRHPGKSATYGCPFRVCNLRSKSQRHFREHLAKHDRNDKIENGEDPCQLLNYQLVRYIVNDEIGMGYGRSTWSPPRTASPSGSTTPLPVQKVIIRARPQVKIAPANSMSSGGHQNQSRIVRIATDRKLQITGGVHHHGHLNHRHNNHERFQETPPSQAPPTSVRYYVPVSSSASNYQMDDGYHNHHHNHHNTELNEYEEEYLEDEEVHQNIEQDEDYDDDGPPVLNPETVLNSEEVEGYERIEEEEQWIDQEEVVNTEVRVFSNGFIDDDELD